MNNIFLRIYNKIKFFPNKYDLLWFGLIPILNINYMIADHMILKGIDLSTPLDKLIPFISQFVIPYVYWYIYIPLGFIIILSKSRIEYMRIFISLIIGMCICYAIFYILPTEISRPTPDNSNIFNRLVNLVYKKDRPFNCFPSLHVLSTYLLMRYTKKSYSKILFYYTQIVGVLIILSTLFIKQHFILDMITSISLVELIMVFTNAISKNVLIKTLNLTSIFKFLK